MEGYEKGARGEFAPRRHTLCVGSLLPYHQAQRRTLLSCLHNMLYACPAMISVLPLSFTDIGCEPEYPDWYDPYEP